MEPVREHHQHPDEPGQPRRLRPAGRGARVALASRRGVPDRPARRADAGFRAGSGHLDGPVRGPDAGTGDAPAVAGALAGGRRHVQRRQHLRHRLQLRVPQHLVARPDDADAARDQPAHGVRAAVRRRRQHRRRRAALPREAAAQHPRRGDGQGRQAAGRPGRRGPAQAGQLPRRGSRDRAAHPDRRSGRPTANCRCWSRPPASRSRSRTTPG